VPPRIASFTGRSGELDRLDAILMHDKPAAVTQASVGRVAVQGMGGVGKTSLAIEYAHRFRGLYAGVCWCPAETRTGVLSALAGLAVTLGAATAEEADVERAAKAAMRRLSEQRATWLLVYDNAPAPDAVADLLPSAGARVLITSRFSDWSELADEVALDALPMEESIALLQSRTGRSDAAGAGTLAEALGRLPLALDHAAAYCKRTQTRFADYAEKASGLISAAPRGVGYPRSVAATFDLAITEAVAQGQSAEALMAYLAQCAPDRIPMTLVDGAVEGEVERQQALAALAEVSLLKHDPFEDGTPAVTVHRLVQAVARARSETNGSAQDAVERLIARLDAIYPEQAYEETQAWPFCAQLTPHLLALRDTRPDDLADWSGLLDSVGKYFYGRAVYPQAAALFRDALASCEKTLGPDVPGTATCLNNIGRVLCAQGDLSSARPLLERALAIYERALGPEHRHTATGLKSLAYVRKEQGDFTGSRRLYERALAICEKALGPKHPSTAGSINDLARLLEDQGNFEGARPLFERALAIREKVQGPKHPDTALSLHNLAGLRHRLDDVAGARLLYERALGIFEKALGAGHPKTARSLGGLAHVLMDQGDFVAARPLFERALAIHEKVLGPEDIDAARSLRGLANLFMQQGDLPAARPLFERAVAVHEKVLGPDHVDTAVSLYILGRLLNAQGDVARARLLFERALAVLEKVLGPQHPNTNSVRRTLAEVLLATGTRTEALAFGEKALDHHDKVLGRGHSSTKDSARVTADALDALGRTEEAKALRDRYGVTGQGK
jgi:tetratricopeptide (TPR) repeat protein